MSHPPIAIVGVSALFPGSTDAHGFWSDILAGRDLIGDIPPSHWLIEDYYDPDPKAPDKTYARRGAFLGDIKFDPMAFGVPPNIVPATDTSQLLALIVAGKVLEDAAQGQFASMDREKMSIVLGVTSAQELMLSMTSRLQRPVWLRGLREAGVPEDEAQAICDRIANNYVPWQEATFPGLLGNVVAGRIANRFDLRGTNAVTDAACASTMAALSMGLNELYTGQSDLVIAGGVDTMNDISMYVCFSKTPALSKSGDCRPFSDAADGTLLGEGLAMLALKRLDDAERDGDRIYSVIRGLGSSSDGRGPSVYAPLPAGQARALRRTYEVAGYGPDTVELIEAHGTGTVAGDAAEFEGLRTVFEESGREDRQWCALGSVKSQIGHTKAAAGAAGLFKAVMALHHKVLPATIKVDRPNPKLDLEHSAFYLSTQSRPWIRDGSHPRRASVSSFGFGGSNFHVALEEYTGAGKPAWRYRTAPTELVLVTGADGAAVASACGQIAAEARDRGLVAVARRTQEGFDAKAPARLAVVASGAEDLATKLQAAAAAITKAPAQAWSTPTGSHYATGDHEGGIGFLFPGQGSQYVGMGADVAMTYDAARAAWDAAAGLRFDGLAVQDVALPRPVFTEADRDAQQRALTATEWAQPAIGVASLALLGVMRLVGVVPEVVGGHSFGEVTALCAAGAIDEQALVQIARRRGELMRDAAAVPGAMLAVGRTIEEVRGLVERLGLDVVVANHNHPTQVVLSGATDAVADAEKKLAGEGVAAKRLPVATAFHSPLVAPSTAPFAAFLGDVAVAKPTLDVYSNADAAPYAKKPAAIRETLARQIASPVRFVEQIEAMWARGVRTFVEVGPGAVLTELVGRILGDRPHRAIALDRKGRDGVTMLQEGLGRLAVAGVPLDLAALWAPYAPTPEKSDKKPGMSLDIRGINYGKPYPPTNGAKGLPAPNPPRPVAARVTAPPVASPAPVAARPAAATPNPVQHEAPRMAQPPTHRAPVAPPAVSSDAQLAWVQAYQEAQRQTADAHAAYQRAMADSHMAFLRTVESSFVGLSAMVGGQPMPAQPVALQSGPAQPAWQPPAPMLPAPPPAPVFAAPPAAMAVAPPQVAAPAPVVAAAPIQRAPVAAPAPVARAAAPALDLTALMLSVVAEKTGYPVEMLGLEMELEGDLGIDSIKRVEILSTMREREPSLPEVDAGEMAALRSLGQIVEYMGAHAPDAAPAPRAVALAAAPAASGVDVERLMLDVVAEKTGYPAEMLGLHMELEGDLGIDSIKRVEILSTMRERAPDLPEVDAGEMAALRTLGQIVGYMRDHGVGDAAPAAAPAAPAAAPGLDVERLMLDVVAEKTGYPAEMLGLHMELEGDLGIDSIKRVEILSTMRERAPDLPEVDAGEMAALRTLGQIVGYMRDHGVGPAADAPAAPVAATEPGASESEHGIHRYAVRETDAPAVGLSMAGLTAGRVVVTDDGAGVAVAVTRSLGEHGVTAEIVGQVPPDADVVVFLGGLRAVADVEDAIRVNGEAFHAAKAVAARMAERGGVFVTVQDTGGDFGLSGRDGLRAWASGVAALARTAAIEWPAAQVKAIDLERGDRSADELAAAIVAELFTGGATREVGLHADGRRTTLRMVDVPAPAGAASIGPDDVIVVSGGGRGVTAASIVALAREARPRVVILGRTALEEEPAAVQGATDEPGLKRALLTLAQAEGRKVTPADIGKQTARILANREIRGTMAAIEATGGQARYLPVDVQDAAALAVALADVRAAWGPIAGIVHGAGVLADKLIAEKTPEQFDRVFDTKVLGLRALLDATASDPLKLIAVFSSVAARTGNLGQCDYAMANEVLNKVAAAERARRGGACLVKSFGWGPWEGGMVTPALAARFAQMGVALIPLDVGARMFAEELRATPEDLELVVGGDAGEGALGAASDHAITLDVHVSRAAHPYLADHSIGGKPVVPVVMAVEWFSRAARACRPDLHVAAIRDIKVLRGIKLDRYDGAGDRFTLKARQLSNGDGAVLAVELRGHPAGAPADGVPHYTATIDMTERAVAAPRGQASPAGLGAWDAEVYDGHVLFHGPDFQVIRSLEGVSADGIAGVLSGSRERGWTGADWRTDPAALDGGLQLAVLWARHVLGGASLPMAVGAFHAYGDGQPEGPYRCVVQGRRVSGEKTVCNIALVGEDGRLVAELRGVETILRPGEPTPAPAVRA